MLHSDAFLHVTDPFERLLVVLVPFAERQLIAHGAIVPCAAVVMKSGEVTQLSAFDRRDRPNVDEIICALLDFLQPMSLRGEITASGICFDATMWDAAGPRGDAVTIDLETPGESVRCFYPYSLGDDGLTFEEPGFRSQPHQVFTD